jgi:hypothetical protein
MIEHPIGLSMSIFFKLAFFGCTTVWKADGRMNGQRGKRFSKRKARFFFYSRGLGFRQKITSLNAVTRSS